MSKKKTRKIQDFNRAYSLLHHYVGFVVKLSYSRILHIGKENIPEDGAVIFAPNHTNTLMDALVMLDMDRKPKVFVARADIFKNRKLAKIFTFLKIMPIMRRRDGIQAVRKNQETIEKAVDVLKDRIPFCIFPEGTHQAKYSLLPLSKGIMKIAFQAQKQMPETPLYIVPVGVTYGNFFRFRSTVRLHFGQAINVRSFMTERPHLVPQELMNAMRETLTDRLLSTLLYIPNDDDYNAIHEICRATQPVVVEDMLKRKENKEKDILEVQFNAQKHILERIESIKEYDPEKLRIAIELGNDAYKKRKKLGIDIDCLSVKNPLVSRIPRIALTLVALPYAIPTSILAIPLALLCKRLSKLLKDPAFKNSVMYLLLLLVWPLLVLAYSAIAFALLPWQWALAATILLMPAPIVAHEIWKTMRLVASDVKLMRKKKLRDTYSEIRKLMTDNIYL